SEFGQTGLGGVGFVAASPPGLWVDDVGERIHHRVHIGTDPQAVDLGVIAGVDNDGRVVTSRGDAVGQPRSPATAGQHRRTRAGSGTIHSRYGIAAPCGTAGPLRSGSPPPSTSRRAR